MKKVITLAALTAILEQKISPGFVPFGEQQQQAKTGPVEVITEGDPEVDGVADSDPLRATPGSLLVEALRAASGPQAGVIQVSQSDAVRRVSIVDAATLAAMATAADAISGTTLVATLTWDGGEKNNAPMTNAVADGVGGMSTQINAALAAAKPSFSLSSIVNKLEDIASDVAVDKEIVVIFDQSANSGLGTVKVFVVDTLVHASSAYEAARDNGGSIAAEFSVDTTPAAQADKLAGE